MDLHKVRKGVRIGLAALTVTLMAGASLTQAAGTIRTGNDTTGASSDNDTRVTVANRTDVDASNVASATNVADADVTTGENDAIGNTGDGEVMGGNITGRVRFTTQLNAGSRSWSLPDMGSMSVESGNETTGFNSENNSTVNLTESTDVDVTNRGTATNVVAGDLNTGDNRASRNTGDGMAASGDASVEASLSTDINANAGASLRAIGEGTMEMGDITATNRETGASSANDTRVNVSKTLSVTERNNATATNTVDLDINTGGNESNFNTGDGGVKTGDGSFDISVNNVLN